MFRAHSVTRNTKSKRWTRYLDLISALTFIALTAAFSVALYFDLSGLSTFR